MKAESYLAPFETTGDIANPTIEIGESVGRITAHDSLSLNPKLRRENRIKTIHSTLAIEQNNPSHSQVTDVINGKRVLAKLKQEGKLQRIGGAKGSTWVIVDS